MFTSFETLCGFVKCKTDVGFKGLKYEEYVKKMSHHVSMKDTEFSSIKNDIIEKFLSEYEGDRIE